MFVLSVDGMLGKEVLIIITNLSRLMAAKLEELISHVRSWVNGQLTILFMRSYYHMFFGYCLPSPLQDQELDWDPG